MQSACSLTPNHANALCQAAVPPSIRLGHSQQGGALIA